jgi:hypothetical protein
MTNDPEEFYRYREREDSFRAALLQLEGRVLSDVLLQVIPPEINVVVLACTDATFCVQGQIGGELLDIVPAAPPPVSEVNPHARYERFEPASDLLGREIVQARAIGQTWNGHGLELSFRDRPGRSLIVQSIYTADKPDDAHDCLRIAAGTYTFER